MKPRSFTGTARHLRQHAKPLHRLALADIDRRAIAERLGRPRRSHHRTLNGTDLDLAMSGGFASWEKPNARRDSRALVRALACGVGCRPSRVFAIFFERGAVLMWAYDGAVDHRVFAVRIGRSSWLGSYGVWVSHDTTMMEKTSLSG